MGITSSRPRVHWSTGDRGQSSETLVTPVVSLILQTISELHCGWRPVQRRARPTLTASFEPMCCVWSNQKLPVPHDALRPSPVNNALASCSGGRMLWCCASTLKGPQRTHHPGEEASPQQMVTVSGSWASEESCICSPGGPWVAEGWEQLGKV